MREIKRKTHYIYKNRNKNIENKTRKTKHALARKLDKNKRVLKVGIHTFVNY